MYVNNLKIEILVIGIFMFVLGLTGGCHPQKETILDTHTEQAVVFLEYRPVFPADKMNFISNVGDIKSILSEPMPMPSKEYEGMNLIDVLEKLTNRKIVFFMRYPFDVKDTDAKGYARLTPGKRMADYNHMAEHWLKKAKSPTLGWMLSSLVNLTSVKYEFTLAVAADEPAPSLRGEVFDKTFILFTDKEILIITNSWDNPEAVNAK